MTQSSQKYLISDDCDYDRTPHKMVTTLFLRIAIMITVLINCTIYEDCDHDRGPHKNIIFLGFYMIVIIITVFFIRIAIMIAVFTILYMSIYDHGRNPKRGLRSLSYSSQNAISLKFCEDYDYDRSSHKMLYSPSVLKELIANTNKMRSVKKSIKKSLYPLQTPTVT